MALDLTKLGPRGWALVIPLACVAITFLFLQSKSGISRNESPAKSGNRPIAADGLLTEFTAIGQSHQSKMDAGADRLAPTLATTPEFPNWARKPSQLDVLISEQGSSQFPPSEKTDAIRPLPLQPWISEPTKEPSRSENALAASDRHSPFAEPKSDAPASQASVVSSTQEKTPNGSQLAWPDANYVAAPSRNHPPIGQPGAFAAHSQTSGTNASDSKAPQKPIGASLRSNPVPNQELFIVQPGYKADH